MAIDTVTIRSSLALRHLGRRMSLASPFARSVAPPVEEPEDEVAPEVVDPSETTSFAVGSSRVIEVTDDVGVAFVSIWFIRQGSAVWELIFDGTDFGPAWQASLRTVISGGFRFVLVRSGGWPAETFEVKVEAVDSSGNRI